MALLVVSIVLLVVAMVLRVAFASLLVVLVLLLVVLVVLLEIFSPFVLMHFRLHGFSSFLSQRFFFNLHHLDSNYF